MAENNNDNNSNEDIELQNEEENLDTKEQVELPIDNRVTYIWDESRDINQEIETSYLDYAMSVIVSRALPDVRDWLKPVHRRILYAMHDLWLRSTAKYRKSAAVVWEVLAKYHPHGDSSVYEAMVRLAQDFSMRYPLVDGQWNFGSMDWDNAAAMRYTEAKMTKLAEYMLSDIEKETVDFRDNYDATRKEPIVLPTRIPELLMNWVMGIAVGMATNIPPHNLWELIEALEYLLKVPEIEDVTVEDLMQFIKWPDFPTGWIVYDKDAILQAYSTWRWSVIMRWVANIEENSRWRKIINISEVPYNLNKSTFIEKLADLVKEKKIEWISDIRDESSNKDWVRVIIELKRDSFPKKVLNLLYKLTSLQTSFGYNMISLWERWKQPKIYNLKEILIDFIEHRKEVITRRTIYELKIAEARAHILEWLKKALDHIDEIIKTIKQSQTKDEARVNLMAQFSFSELQANAILEMQLSKLAWLERKKIEDELDEKHILIIDLKDVLSKPERVVTLIIEELDYIKETFADPRRTKVNASKVWEFNAKDTIPNEEIVIVLSKNNYIKRIKASSFRLQRRWWKGITTATKEDDEIQTIVPTNNHNDLLFFTTKGRVFTLPAYEIPETQRTAKWQPIINLLSLQKDETVAAILDITEEKNKYLFFVSSAWTVKKLDMKEVKNIRTSWLIVLKIREWEDLVWVKTTSWDDNILIATRLWKAIQFDEWDVRPMGRAAAWVRWIRIKWDDEVIEVTIVSKDAKYLFIVTENGMWKISDLEWYRSQWRWGSWVKAMNVTPKTGRLISAAVLSQEELKESSVLLMSKDWQTIKLALSSVRVTWRVTQWVILTKIKWNDDILVSAKVVRSTWDEEEEVEVI